MANLNIPTIDNLPQNTDIFSVQSYPHFAEVHGAVDTKWEGKRYIIMHPPFDYHLNFVNPYYANPQYMHLLIDGLDYVAIEIPEDAIFLGSIDLSEQGVGADPSQHLFAVNSILNELGRDAIKDWQDRNGVELPFAYSPSTNMLYGLLS